MPSGPARPELLDSELVTRVGLLLEVASSLERRLDANLRGAIGLPVSSHEVLIRLERTPGHRKPLVELGRELAITTGGVTRLIDRLERDGLVRRVRVEGDRRMVYAEITEAGSTLVGASLPAHVADLEAVFAALSAEEQRALDVLLRSLRDRLWSGR